MQAKDLYLIVCERNTSENIVLRAHTVGANVTNYPEDHVRYRFVQTALVARRYEEPTKEQDHGSPQSRKSSRQRRNDHKPRQVPRDPQGDRGLHD